MKKNGITFLTTRNPDKFGKLRNQSAILQLVILFEVLCLLVFVRNSISIFVFILGMFKSTLLCPICRKTSVKFDPFFDISVPLPSKSFIAFSVTLISFSDSMAHKEIRISMKSSHSIGDVKGEIAKAIGIGDEKKGSLILAHVFDDEFIRFFLEDNESIANISSNDELYCYLPTMDFSNLPSLATITVPVIQRVSGPKLTDDRKGYVSTSKPVSFPFLITLPRRIKYADLRQYLLRKFPQLVAISAPIKNGDLPIETLANSFGLSKGYFTDRNPKPLIASDNTIVTFSNGDVLSIDWCPQGVAQERFSRMRPKEIIEVSPDGTDLGSELNLIDCLKAFTREEKLSAEEAWYPPIFFFEAAFL
jgi:hypothetical protein